MIALIVLLVLGVWSALLYNAGFYASFAIQRKWVRQLMGIVAVVGGTALALWDEVKGVQEFEQLCKTGGVYQIAPEAVGKKFDLKSSYSDRKTLQGYTRPVDQETQSYTDNATGQIVATAYIYFAKGGWLVRHGWLPTMSGGQGPLFGRSQCFPGDVPEQAARRQAITRKIIN